MNVSGTSHVRVSIVYLRNILCLVCVKRIRTQVALRSVHLLHKSSSPRPTCPSAIG